MKLRDNINKKNTEVTSQKSQISFFVFFTQFICHRIPERTFNIQGHYFPVCSRCTGFYIAALSYFIYVYFYYVQYTTTLIVFAFLLLIPSLLDGLTQLIGLRESNNMLRLLTGLMGGLGLAILVKTFKYIFLIHF